MFALSNNGVQRSRLLQWNKKIVENMKEIEMRKVTSLRDEMVICSGGYSELKRVMMVSWRE